MAASSQANNTYSHSGWRAATRFHSCLTRIRCPTKTPLCRGARIVSATAGRLSFRPSRSTQPGQKIQIETDRHVKFLSGRHRGSRIPIRERARCAFVDTTETERKASTGAMPEGRSSSDNQQGVVVRMLDWDLENPGSKCPGSLMSDLGPVTYFQPYLPHRAVVKLKRECGQQRPQQKVACKDKPLGHLSVLSIQINPSG